MHRERDRRLAAYATTGMMVLAGWGSVALACEQVEAPNVTAGMLGAAWSTGGMAETRPLPRNPAFAYWPSHSAPMLSLGGMPVALEPLGPEPGAGEAGLMTPREPLEPGAVYALEGVGEPFAFTVEDFIDTEAPSTPALLDQSVEITDDGEGCAESSCGTVVVVKAQLAEGRDDRTPAGHLTYALYLGSTAAKARQVERPARLGFLEGDETWFYAGEAWADRDLYLSVAALDLAGNESARTEPVLLRRAPSG